MGTIADNPGAVESCYAIDVAISLAFSTMSVGGRSLTEVCAIGCTDSVGGLHRHREGEDDDDSERLRCGPTAAGGVVAATVLKGRSGRWTKKRCGLKKQAGAYMFAGRGRPSNTALG